MLKIDLKAMSDQQLVSLICQAQAVISDRAKARNAEFSARVAQSLRNFLPGSSPDPTAHQGTDAMQGGADV